MRYQLDKKKSETDRHRGRFRLRAGIESPLTESIKVAFGIASGSGDPRSGNQTFTDSFAKPALRIDYAFAQFTPFKALTLIGGKMKNPLFTVSDLLWDTDITPEGIAAIVNLSPVTNLNIFFNINFFILDELKETKEDPFMLTGQAGINWKLEGLGYLKLGAVYYAFNHIKGKLLDHSSKTNTYDTDDKGTDVLTLHYNYNSVNPMGEFGLINIIPFIPCIAVFGEYIKNFDPKSDNTGYSAGIKLGHEHIKEFGQWQIKYMYRYLEKDAWPDIFPDSDAYEGSTGVQGHEGVGEIGLSHNVTFGLDYYYMKIIDLGKPAHVLQVDFLLKF